MDNWKCRDCGAKVAVAADDYALLGTPYCDDCDREMDRNNRVEVDDFVRGYLGTALWSSTVSLPCGEEMLIDGCMDVDEDHVLHGTHEFDALEEYFDINDFDDDSLRKAQKDCDNFRQLMENVGLWDSALEYEDEDHIAHDFWLTRNGHGDGFWHGDYQDHPGQKDSVGNKVTVLVKEHFNELNIWIDDDGSLYFE